MDDAQKKYILENAQTISPKKIAQALNLKEHKIRKFLERADQKKKLPEPQPVTVEPLRARQVLLLGLGLLGLGLLIYSNTFHASFHLDDTRSIVENPAMLNAFDFGFLWKSYGLRAFTYFTLALNYHFGKLDVFGYHLVNIGIHILCSMMVFFILYLTTQTPTMKRRPLPLPAFWIALGGSLFFLSHPIQTQAVTYIVQRAASLATLLYVSTAVCYIQWRLKQNFLFYGFAILTGILAMLSKEIAATLPFALLLYEFCFFDKDERKSSHVLLLMIPFFLLLLILIPGIQVLKIAGSAGALPTDSGAVPRGVYLLTQFRVISKYIQLLFLPLHQNLDYDFPPSGSFADPATLACFLFLSGVIFAGVVLFKRQRFLAFGVFWFFLALSVESSMIPIRDVISEHRLYLPMVGFCFVLCGALSWFIRDVKQWCILFIAIALILSWLTYRRNSIWKNELTLWENVIQEAPKKGRGYSNLGLAYSNEKKYDKAIEYSLKAVQFAPEDPAAVNDLGLVYSKAKLSEKAIEAFRKAIAIRPNDFPNPYNNLGATLDDMGRYDEAIENYLHAIRIDPNYYLPYFNLGTLYLSQGDFGKALDQVHILRNLRQYQLAERLNSLIASQKANRKPRTVLD